MQALEGADHGTEGAAGGFEDIEVLQKRYSIATDVEDSATFAASARTGWIHRAEKRLHEVELHSVGARRHRDSVAEIAEAFAGSIGWELRRRLGTLITRRTPVNEEIITSPAVAVDLKLSRLSGQDPNRFDPSVRFGNQLDCTDERALGVGQEIQVHHSIRSRRDVLKCTNIHGAWLSVSDRIEVPQECSPIELDLEVVEILRVLLACLFASRIRVREIKQHLVDRK